jgi:aryl-alcohol dehydrogenase-like predicted oxidoreductase
MTCATTLAAMELTRTAFGTWNGGRFMNYGAPLEIDRYLDLIRRAYDRGVRTFLTADVYGNGAADELLGRGLDSLPRESYCLVGMVGHDIYTGQREGAKGYPRFTHPALRIAADYSGYLRMATEKSLARCRATRFDLLMLHNPDRTGYTSDAVWKAMEQLRTAGLTERLGIAPGPANGFSLDLILNFERFGSLLDWAMIILNPFEPWPAQFALAAAEKNGVSLIARVVDYGGIFHGDVKPGHVFAKHDHRSFRPAGWVEAAQAKVEKIRPIAERHRLSLLQLACAWTLSQQAMKCVVPTLIQEIGVGARPIEDKLDELAALPDVTLTPEECDFIRHVGDNTGCMKLKGASAAHEGDDLPDNWRVHEDVADVARRWHIEPSKDLAYTH